MTSRKFCSNPQTVKSRSSESSSPFSQLKNTSSRCTLMTNSKSDPSESTINSRLHTMSSRWSSAISTWVRFLPSTRFSARMKRENSILNLLWTKSCKTTLKIRKTKPVQGYFRYCTSLWPDLFLTNKSPKNSLKIWPNLIKALRKKESLAFMIKKETNPSIVKKAKKRTSI